MPLGASGVDGGFSKKAVMGQIYSNMQSIQPLQKICIDYHRLLAGAVSKNGKWLPNHVELGHMAQPTGSGPVSMFGSPRARVYGILTYHDISIVMNRGYTMLYIIL